MKREGDKGPFVARGASGLTTAPLPEYSEERGDAQIRTADDRWGLQLQRRGREVFLAIGSVGPVSGSPEGVGLYVMLIPQGLEYMYRWLTKAGREMAEEQTS